MRPDALLGLDPVHKLLALLLQPSLFGVPAQVILLGGLALLGRSQYSSMEVLDGSQRLRRVKRQRLPHSHQPGNQIHFGVSGAREVDGPGDSFTGQGVGDGLGLGGVVAHVVAGLRLSATRPIKACQQ